MEKAYLDRFTLQMAWYAVMLHLEHLPIVVVQGGRSLTSDFRAQGFTTW